ncbi:MAG: phage major capsid protein [Pseudomonadota bacterium]
MATNPETRRRTATIEITRAAEDADRIEVSISSERPVERGGFTEILDHRREAVNLERAREGLPLLLDHDPAKLVGRVVDVHLRDRKLRGALRFGKTQLAQEVREDTLAGTRRDISVGYSVDQAQEAGDGLVRVSRWTPFETSFVGVAADPSVGVGRSYEPNLRRPQDMEDNDTRDEPEARPDNARANRQERRAEKNRIEGIASMGARRGMEREALEAIQRGTTEAEFQRQYREKMERECRDTTPMLDSLSFPAVHTREHSYSLMRVINAGAAGKPLMGLEAETAKELEYRAGKSAEGIYVPMTALSKRAVLETGTPALGGNLVGTEHLASEHIHPLRNASRVVQLGARVLPLKQNANIPRQTGSATAEWIAEDAAATESDLGFDQVALSPKIVSALLQWTKKMAIQSEPAIEALAQDDLKAVIGLAVDLAAIKGAGTALEPEGILNTTGIGDVAGGTDGAAPTWDHVIQLESELAIDNADVGTLGYLTNASVQGKLKRTTKVAGDAGAGFIMSDRRDGEFGVLNGYRTAVSNQVPSDLTKGSGTDLSAIIFGNFSDLLIGEWGAIDLIVDPYTFADKGNVRIVAHYFVDIAVRHAESFAAMQDAVTI